jgi:hypothetical protein
MSNKLGWHNPCCKDIDMKQIEIKKKKYK